MKFRNSIWVFDFVIHFFSTNSWIINYLHIRIFHQLINLCGSICFTVFVVVAERNWDCLSISHFLDNISDFFDYRISRELTGLRFYAIWAKNKQLVLDLFLSVPFPFSSFNVSQEIDARLIMGLYLYNTIEFQKVVASVESYTIYFFFTVRVVFFWSSSR